MILLAPDQLTTLRDWFIPDRPGPLIGLHVLQTGNGSCFADRWPEPRAILVETAGNYSFAGDPGALRPEDLRGRVAGFVEAPKAWLPLLKEAFSGLQTWDRVIQELHERPHFAPPDGYLVRRLGPSDAYHLWGLSQDSNWLAKTWGGPPGLAASGCGWGAFAGGRLAAVACTFFAGASYEDIGVVTEPEFRGLGLSATCSAVLCGDILERGRRPSWTTSPDNTASLRVAEKLGFTFQRHDYLYVAGIAIPEPARRQDTI